MSSELMTSYYNITISGLDGTYIEKVVRKDSNIYVDIMKIDKIRDHIKIASDKKIIPCVFLSCEFPDGTIKEVKLMYLPTRLPTKTYESLGILDGCNISYILSCEILIDIKYRFIVNENYHYSLEPIYVNVNELFHEKISGLIKQFVNDRKEYGFRNFRIDFSIPSPLKLSVCGEYILNEHDADYEYIGEDKLFGELGLCYSIQFPEKVIVTFA